MDNLSRQERSERMSRIKNADTGPEMIVRRLVHGMGFRFRLHARDLPGIPDLVFPGLGKIIFVHGCCASAPGLRKAAEIPIGLLVKEAFPKPGEGLSESTGAAFFRLANPDSVGVCLLKLS